MNMVRKGRMREETSWDRWPVSPAYLEWRPKLNRKLSLYVHDIPVRFLTLLANRIGGKESMRLKERKRENKENC
jgi:hypothetical protein